MRIAVLSDIHSNLPALEAVLRDLDERGGCDRLWCLGDIVGYGPHPDPCIERIRELAEVCLAGNHDLGTLEAISRTPFRREAALALEWTAAQLSDAHREFLSGLEPQQTVEERWTLVHGGPGDPVWEYVISPLIAQHALESIATPYCLVGHSHLPLMHWADPDGGFVHQAWMKPGDPVELDGRRVLNPGSVGQPRDGDPRASYLIIDGDKGLAENVRVAYEIGRTQDDIIEAGLPESLALRLRLGR